VAGILLALGTIKPQLIAIVLLWLLIWSVGDWRARRPLFRGFAVTMLFLLAASNYVLPGWIHRFRAAAAQYLQYTGGGKSVLDVVLTPAAGKWVAIGIVVAALVALWLVRRAPAGSPQFHWCLAGVMAVTLAVIPTYAPYNQLLLIPCLMVLIGHSHALPGQGSRLGSQNQGREPGAPARRVFVIITAVSIVWPWISSGMLDVALLFYPAVRVQSAWMVPLFTSLIIPITVLGLTAVLAFDALRKPAQTAG
jgi:hypothetical protein